MSVYRWAGLETIKVGAVALTSVGHYMPSTFTTITNIVPDSARILFEVPDDTKIYVEDSTDPDMTFSGGEQSKTVEFATRDMGLGNTWILAFGGTTDGTVYSFPTTATTLSEKSVRCITNAVNGYQMTIDIPRASMRPSAELRMYNRNPDSGEVGFAFTVMKATTDGGTVVNPLRLTVHT